MITMRKSLHDFRLLSYMGMGLRLAALWASGALPIMSVRTQNVFNRGEGGWEWYTMGYIGICASKLTASVFSRFRQNLK